MITPETIAELRRLHSRATMTDWVVEEHMDGIVTIETGGEALWERINVAQLSVDGAERLRGETNAKLIALMRNNLLSLLDALAAAEAERDRLREAAKEARSHLDAALRQSIPADDRIIVDHMRDAHDLLRSALAATQGEGT